MASAALGTASLTVTGRRADLLAILRSRRYAVQASVSADGAPQAAVVGVAVTNAFEMIFDTLQSTRKAANLAANPRIAFVFGSLEDDSAVTVQYEGVADQPVGPDLAAAVDCYLSVFPDGRERQAWPGLTYFRVRPTWIRLTDFRTTPPTQTEFSPTDLTG